MRTILFLRQGINRLAFFSFAIFVACAFLIQGCNSFQKQSNQSFVTYTLEPILLKNEKDEDELQSHLKVKAEFSYSAHQGEQNNEKHRLLLPNWAPGAYQYNVFSSSVKNLRAFDAGGKEIEFDKVEDGIWSLSQAPRWIEYDVYRFSKQGLMWPEKTEITERNIFFNSTNVFLTLEGCRSLPCYVEIKVPKGWKAISPILSEAGKGYANNFDELVDSPVYLGNPIYYSIPLLDREFRFTIDLFDISKDSIAFRADSILALTKEVIMAHQKFFGEIPLVKYDFIIRLSKPKLFTSYGALEHRSSSVYEMPIYPIAQTRDNALLQVIAHEFFHLWNPKRIYPESLYMPNLQRRFRIKNMWFIEGVTDYLSELLMMKQGIQTESAFLFSILERMKRHKRSLKSDSLSLEKLSLNLSESNNNADFIPFYERGTTTAMMLDLEIRKQTNGMQSLEKAILELNLRFGESQKPYPEEQLIEVLESLTNCNLQDFAKRYISSTEELPYESLFQAAGYRYFAEHLEVPNVGLITEQNSNGQHIVTFIAPDSPAEKAGLMSDDIILKANDFSEYHKVHQILFKTGALKNGDVLSLNIKRKESIISVQLKVKTRIIIQEKIEIDSNATAIAKKIRETLIHWSQVSKN
ncbi:MAG: hypothetical protein SFU91_02890 [Chloroherpetonaceae bacterium]|nr:hypothetical protein [Chloroherpetonaceae bacterium]